MAPKTVRSKQLMITNIFGSEKTFDPRKFSVQEGPTNFLAYNIIGLRKLEAVRHIADTPQAPSRHPPETFQDLTRHPHDTE